MSQRIPALRSHYLAGLRRHLGRAPGERAREAMALGRQVAVIGLETLELARIHQWSLDVLGISKGRFRLIAQAEHFFAEVTTLIVAMHGGKSSRSLTLSGLKQTLRERTRALKQTRRTMRRNVEKRQVTEAALKANGRQYGHLLKETHAVRDTLRQLTRKGLKAQERQRSQLSRELQDDIAQTLLGINARLHHLRTKAGTSSQGLADDMAQSQLLVMESRRSVRKVARRLGGP